ncbi:MAG: hypothetical protein MUO40_04875 [Anaerolineaceae bacterium]|nr:hypothetical protein [Anaerolineaceae bacterium]
MRVGFMQFAPVRKSVKENIEQVTKELSKLEFDLMVLPELANSGYLFKSTSELLPYSEPGDGSGIFLKGLQDICERKDACIVSGFSESSGKDNFNSSAAITKNGIISIYRKTHLYNTEKSLFSSGTTGFNVFEFKGIKIGMMICFDWIFPESARSLALQGCQVIAHPSNLVMPYCQTAMITRSIENGVFSITANRIGREALGNMTLEFTGKSQITNPGGEILASASKDQDQIMIVDIDPRVALNKKISEGNDLFLDRHPELYKFTL